MTGPPPISNDFPTEIYAPESNVLPKRSPASFLQFNKKIQQKMYQYNFNSRDSDTLILEL